MVDLPSGETGVSRRVAGLVMGCCGLMVSASTLGEEAIQAFEPLEAIQRRAFDFLAAQHRQRAEPPRIRLGSLDPRLRLPKCGTLLEVFLPGGARVMGNTSVGVRCPGPGPWTVYQSASVEVFDPVLVASRFLNKGTVLVAADFHAERRDLSTLPGGYETAPERLIGKQLRRPLMAGTVISPQAVRTLPAIRRGETVTLVIREGGLEVGSSGVALGDASGGERLRVRNSGSGRVVEGTVASGHQVEVGR